MVRIFIPRGTMCVETETGMRVYVGWSGWTVYATLLEYGVYLFNRHGIEYTVAAESVKVLD